MRMERMTPSNPPANNNNNNKKADVCWITDHIGVRDKNVSSSLTQSVTYLFP